ncbi:G-box-binding factor 1-like [Durio zibethinus]|uniref:G-box-binding factor 1-like n=1 Tax=Durio zibethinus TaxID=66656 RepID=A0A6P6BAJ4_DURZI|nr:G-box-binding factor 1-like [Durio zibethinus]
MDAIVFSLARSCTNWCYWKGNQFIPAIEPAIQIPTSHVSCVPACRKLDRVAAWLMNGLAAAFFMSLERCYCIRIDTKDDAADDIQLLALQDEEPEQELARSENNSMAWPVISASGSDELNQNQTNSNSSGLVEPNPPVPIIDERKRRRMMPNRESARRSRMRKQKHLENLRNEVNRFSIENRELTNRLRFVWYHCHRVRKDNSLNQ